MLMVRYHLTTSPTLTTGRLQSVSEGWVDGKSEGVGKIEGWVSEGWVSEGVGKIEG